jgi:hypothetical protein
VCVIQEKVESGNIPEERNDILSSEFQSANVSNILRQGGGGGAVSTDQKPPDSLRTARLKAKAAIMAKTKKAVVRSVLAIVLYVGCWTPYLLIIAYKIISGNRAPPILDAWASFLAISNSLWDFCLVLWMDGRLKQSFRQVFVKKFYTIKKSVMDLIPQ